VPPDIPSFGLGLTGERTNKASSPLFVRSSVRGAHFFFSYTAPLLRLFIAAFWSAKSGAKTDPADKKG